MPLAINKPPLYDRIGDHAWEAWFSDLCDQVNANSVVSSVITKSSYTVGLTDGYLFVNATAGPVTILMPFASTKRRRLIVIKKTDTSANAVTVQAKTGDTIDGAATQSLSTANACLTLVSDTTTHWWITSRA
jgi:hypothetical protein